MGNTPTRTHTSAKPHLQSDNSTKPGKTPWSTTRGKVAEAINENAIKKLPKKATNQYAQQARQAIRAQERILNLATSTKAHAEEIIQQLNTIAQHITDSSTPRYTISESIEQIARQCDEHHTHANAWCAAARKQTFCEWV